MFSQAAVRAVGWHVVRLTRAEATDVHVSVGSAASQPLIWPQLHVPHPAQLDLALPGAGQ